MILIIAKGNNYNHLNQIRLIDSLEQLYYDYGRASNLSLSCDRAFELGQSKLYVCNIQSDSDYFELIEQIRSLKIDYILLPGLRQDNKLKLKDGRELPISLILSALLPYNQFILTDYHARDFKNMSQFLDHYNKIRLAFERQAFYKSNIALVANHLISSDDASIDVACSLMAAETGDYPRLECGDSFFNLENEDFRMPIIYFKNQIALNLFNLDTGIASNLIAQKVIKAINKEILSQLDYLIGSRFTKNTMFTVKAQVEKVLSMRLNTYYKKYRLVDITIKNDEIIIDIDIYPFFSIDAIRTKLTVKGI